MTKHYTRCYSPEWVSLAAGELVSLLESPVDSRPDVCVQGLLVDIHVRPLLSGCSPASMERNAVGVQSLSTRHYRE